MIWGRASSPASCRRPTTPAFPTTRTSAPALRAYMEWAVAEVLAISPPGEHAQDGLPVPRWGWNGLE